MSAAAMVRPPAGCGAGCSCRFPHYDPDQKRIHVFSTGAWKEYVTLPDGSLDQVDCVAQEGAQE